MNWDDLRFVLAVADHGSVASAAREIGVNHTTVLRRVHAFEEAQQVHLFERLPSGYVLTPEGEQLVATTREMDNLVTSLKRQIVGKDLKLEGVIRVTTTDSFMSTVLPRPFASFRRKHPRITIELALTNSRLNLTKRDADVAIRPVKELPAGLTGRHVAKVGFAVYGAKDYLKKHPKDVTASGHVWLAGDDVLAHSPIADWMRHRVPDAKIAFHADSYMALRSAASAGLGLAALPCCLGDSDAKLKRILGPFDDMTTNLWLLTHHDLAKAARIRAFMDHMEEALFAQEATLAGKPSSTDGKRRKSAGRKT